MAVLATVFLALGLLSAVGDPKHPLGAASALMLAGAMLLVWWRSRGTSTGASPQQAERYVEHSERLAEAHADAEIPASDIDLEIGYLDHAGIVTQRRVTPIRIDQHARGYGRSPRLHAYCHLRRQERTFVIASISDAKYAKTGESASPLIPVLEWRLGIATENPERDAWEEHAYDRKTERYLHRELRITYFDADGQISRRDITLLKYARTRYDGRVLVAECHLRRRQRCFHVDQIYECFDRDAGKPIYDLVDDLDAKFDASPEGSVERLRRSWGCAIRIVLFIGRADGRLTRAERMIISGLCRFLVRDGRVTDALVDEMLDAQMKPDLGDFETAVNELATRDFVSRMAVLRGAELILATDKTVTELERRSLEALRSAMAL